MKRIYLFPPHLDGREWELLIEVYESNWVTALGPQVDAFEQEICEKNRGETCCGSGERDSGPSSGIKDSCRRL